MSWRGLAPPRYRNETVTSTGGYAAGSDRLYATLSADYISVGANETLPWNNVTVTGSSIVDNGGGVFEIGATGNYQISARFVGSTTRAVELRVNGISPTVPGPLVYQVGASFQTVFIGEFTAGDVLDLNIVTSATTLSHRTFLLGGYSVFATYFQIVRLS